MDLQMLGSILGLAGAGVLVAGVLAGGARSTAWWLLLGSGMLVAGMVVGGAGAFLLFSGHRSIFNPRWDLAMDLAGFIDFLGIFLFGLGFLWFRLRRRALQSP